MSYNPDLFTIKDGVLFKCRDTGSEIVVPEGVTQIAPMAFHNLQTVRRIILPTGLKKIGDRAFHCCRNLQSVEIPSTVTAIGDLAFCCTDIQQITLPPKLRKISRGLFETSAIREIVIPRSVQTIADAAFVDCRHLESVTLPASLKTIQSRAFHCCDRLARINLSPTVTVGHNAFGMCKGLADNDGFVILNGTLYESPAMYNSNTVVIPNGVTVLNQATPEANTIIGFADIYGELEQNFCKELVIPESDTQILPGAISWQKLKSITFHCKCALGSLVFSSCKALRSITIGRDVAVSDNLFSYTPEENEKAMKKFCITYID